MSEINYEEVTEEFFKRRFPEEDYKVQKTCKYFAEWVERFKSRYPEEFMDNKSKIIYSSMIKDGLI